MDDARGLGRGRAGLDGPGPALLDAGGEVRQESKLLVCRANERLQASLLDSQIAQILLSLGGLQLVQLGLDLSRDDHHVRTLRLRLLHQRLDVHVVLALPGEILLGHVCRVNHRLFRQQAQHLDEGLLVFVELDGPGRDAALQAVQDPLQCRHLHFVLFLLLGLGSPALFQLLHALLDLRDVREDELKVDDVRVVDRVDFARHVDHIRVLETSDHLDDGIALPDVGQELVSEPLSLGSALHKAGNVIKLHRRRHGLERFRHLNKLVQPRVRHGDHADVGLDRAKRKVGCLRLSVLADGVEHGRLADVGQAHDAVLQRLRRNRRPESPRRRYRRRGGLEGAGFVGGREARRSETPSERGVFVWH